MSGGEICTERRQLDKGSDEGRRKDALSSTTVRPQKHINIANHSYNSHSESIVISFEAVADVLMAARELRPRGEAPVADPAPHPLKPLDRRASMVRPSRTGRAFVSISKLDKRKGELTDFYDRCAIEAHENPQLSYVEAADRVASRFDLKIDKQDRGKVKAVLSQRKKAKASFDKLMSNVDEAAKQAAPKASSGNGIGKRSQNRVGRGGRKRKLDDDTALPTDSTQASFKGGRNHFEYQDRMKAAAAEAASSKLSLNKAARNMLIMLQAQEPPINVSFKTCQRHVKSARENGGVALTPQKPGGCYLPAYMERDIAGSIRNLRARHMLVFPDDVKGWCRQLVEGTPYHNNFLDAEKKERPTAYDGWYRGFLERNGFLTGPMRPLEMTRAEWFTAENLEKYYRVAKDLLVDAGVAEINPHYDPNLEYSEEIVITHPERICSYDETKVELDCTSGGKGKTDTFIRDGRTDDGTGVVTKTGKCASAACGRMGDGRTLPVYMVLASGEEVSGAWTPELEAPDIFDKEGNTLKWRYTSNVKGSVDSEFCKDYLTEILHPALGYPPSRDERPRCQGVIICDGVGSHLTLAVLERAVELGMEILLRVPNLSFILQGEDTVNFKELKAEFRLQKAAKFRKLNDGRRTDASPYIPLGYEHLMECFLPAHTKAFTKERNMMGWQIEGVIPFTKKQWWKKKKIDEEKGAKSAASRVSQSTLLSSAAASTGTAVGGLPESTEQTTVSAPVGRHQSKSAFVLTEEGQQHLRLIKNLSRVDFTGQLDAAKLLENNILLQKAAAGLAKEVEQANAPPKKAARTTAKDMFGRKGSATGAEIMEKLRKEAREKAAKDAQSARNKDNAAAKKANAAAKGVVAGSAILVRLQTEGQSLLDRLKNDDLVALLQNAQPQSTIKKEAKNVLMKKVLELKTVQDALAAAAAVDAAAAAAAVAAAAGAAPPLPPPTMPGSAEALGRASIGSTGSNPSSGPSPAVVLAVVTTPAEHVGGIP